MGGKHGKAPEFNIRDVQRLSQLTGMPENEIMQLHQQFQHAAGRDGVLDKAEFRRLYSQMSGAANNNQQIDQAFRAFDRDNSGKLSFEEFISALILSNSNGYDQDRFSYVIDAHNPNRNDGYITPEYGRQVIDTMNQYYNTGADADQIWVAVDDGSGRVSHDDFVRYLNQSSQFSQNY